MTDPATQWPERVNPLISKAQILLLYSGILSSSSPPDSTQQLQQTLTATIDEFSSALDDIDPEHLDSARYALCALLDETIVSTRWGGPVWPDYSLLRQYYDQDYRGEEFFTRIEAAGRQREQGVQLLELFHLCLSLGYSGRFHQRRQTEGRIKQLRIQVASLIDQYREAPAAALSAPIQQQRQRRRLPIWIMTSLLGALLLGAYQGMSWHLSQVGAPLLKSIQALARDSGR